jgi:hypothetical protein
MKWVVPIMTDSMSAPSNGWSERRPSIASMIPVVTSDVVECLMPVSVRVPSMSTASVLVPPTSMPMCILNAPLSDCF